MQSQKVVTAYFSGDQVPYFALSDQTSELLYHYQINLDATRVIILHVTLLTRGHVASDNQLQKKNNFEFLGVFFRESRILFKIQQNEGTYKPLKRCIK